MLTQGRLTSRYQLRFQQPQMKHNFFYFSECGVTTTAWEKAGFIVCCLNSTENCGDKGQLLRTYKPKIFAAFLSGFVTLSNLTATSILTPRLAAKHQYKGCHAGYGSIVIHHCQTLANSATGSYLQILITDTEGSFFRQRKNSCRRFTVSLVSADY